MQQAPIITVDGPSGVGKGTLSCRLANYLGWHFLDSGAIYRAVALAVIQSQLAWDDISALIQLAEKINIEFAVSDSQTTEVFLEGEPVSDQLRQEEVGQCASTISAVPALRQALLQLQRDFKRPPGLVTDGRDMGTVVFPEADLKLYLTASVEERAKRRFYQLQQAGFHGKFDAVINELKIRDQRDQQREASPLKPAEDAVSIDTTYYDQDEVFNEVLKLLQTKGLLDSDRGESTTNNP